MSLLLLLPHNEVANYVLTAQGGVYNLTGASAGITFTPLDPVIQSVYAAEDSGSFSSTISATLTGVATNSCIVGIVGWGDSGNTINISSVTDGSGGVSVGSKVHVATDNQSGAIFWKEGMSSGSKTFTVTFSSTTPYRRIRLFEVSGIATTSAGDGDTGQGQSSVGTTTDSISSGLMGSTSNATDYIFGLGQDVGNADPGSGTISAGTGYTLIGSNQILYGEWKAVSSTGTQTATFTDTKNSDRTTFVLALKKAAAAGSTYTLTANGGAYSLTGTSASVLRSKKIVSTGGAYSLTGASAILKKSKVIVSTGGSYTLTGANINMVKGRVMTAQGGAYSLTGVSAVLQRSKRIVASGGAYTLTGANAVVSRNRKLIATGGVYTLTGTSAVLTWTPGATNYLLTAQGGAYSLGGGSAVLLRSKNIAASGGSYSITGGSANIYRSKVVVASGGTYTLTGGSAGISRSKKIVATGGSYALAGASATLLRTKLIAALGGTYSLTGASASILKTRLLVGTGGSYTLTGASAVISRNRNLTASGGSYSLVGASVTITYAGTIPAYNLTCQGGTYTLTGASASILRSKLITASGGSYGLTGQSATILRTKYIQASGGSYSISGGAVVITRSKYLNATGGTYTIGGATCTLSRNRKLSATGGQYNLVGTSVVITYAGLGGLVWPPAHTVLLGVQYGPTGTEYTGTLDYYGVKYDLVTKNWIKPVSDKLVISLTGEAL